MDAQKHRDMGLCEPKVGRATCFLLGFQGLGAGRQHFCEGSGQTCLCPSQLFKNIFLSLAVPGLRGRPQAFSRCSEGAPEGRRSRCGSQAWFLRGAWELPRPGIELTSSALTGGFLPTGPQGSPPVSTLPLYDGQFLVHYLTGTLTFLLCKMGVFLLPCRAGMLTPIYKHLP